MTPSDHARAYAEAVAAQEIVAGRYVRLACERFLRDLKRSDWPYRFDEAKANRAPALMQLLPHVKGKWAAKSEKIRLEAWQLFSECNLFGWVRDDCGLRRFRQSYEEIPRKNGKSKKPIGWGHTATSAKRISAAHHPDLPRSCSRLESTQVPG